MSALGEMRLAALAQALPGGVALLLASGCADQPTQPPAGEGAPVVSATLALSTDERGQLRAALLFARGQSGLALARHEAGERVSAAFAVLDERVDADDRAGVERGIAAARAALARYVEVAEEVDGAASAADIGALKITLDQTVELIRNRDLSRGAGGDFRGARLTTTTTSNRRIQP